MNKMMEKIANDYLNTLEKELRAASKLKYGIELEPNEILLSKAPGIGNFYFHKEKKDCFFFEHEISISDKGLEFLGCAVKMEI